MKTCVIYARYSSDRQTEQSIEGQLHVCYDYAKRNNILILDEYIDRAMTGTNDNRRSFQKMLKDSSKRAWDFVLVYKLDRFSRNKYEMAMHRKTLKDNGIKLLSAMENIPDSPEGIILESLLEGMAEYYSAELSQKVKRGLNETRKKGNFTGGFILFGYYTVGDEKTGKKVLIDEEKAKFVRYVFEEYAKGRPVETIWKEINDMGARNRGKPLCLHSVHNMLQSEKYYGKYHYDGEEFNDIYPRIVPEDIEALVKQRQAFTHYGLVSKKVVYLLRHKLFCGYCGKPMTAQCGTGKNGTVNRYYMCTGRREHNGCQKTQARKYVLEDFVVDVTLKALNHDNVIEEIADKLMESQDERLNDKSTQAILKKQKAELEKQIENFLDAIGKGITTMSTKIKLEKLEQELADISAKITAEECKQRIGLSRAEIIAHIRSALQKEPQQMINALVNKVILYNDKIEIYYNYTLRKDPDDRCQGLLFYSGKSSIRVCVSYTKVIQQPMIVELYI